MIMYETFELKRVSEEQRIIGYRWMLPAPDGVVLLIHGIGEHCGRYQHAAERFLAANYACMGMDLRGHGLSMGPEGHCAPRSQILSDMDELIEYAMIRYPGVPLYLYGHSMGGSFALDYRYRGTYNADLAGYILTSPWVLLAKKYSPPAVAGMKLLAKAAPAGTIRYTSGRKPVPEDRASDDTDHSSDPMMHERISFLTVTEGYLTGEAMARGTMQTNGRVAGIPMLLMHGTRDRLCDIEGSRCIAKREQEDCLYIERDGYTHDLIFAEGAHSGDRVIDEMVAFLQG